jgi:zinc resistance-associated protein
MKSALSAIALVAALTFAPLLTGSFAVADDSAQREEHGQRFSPEDGAAFLDARIAALKAGLELNAEQEKNWAPLESAMRDLAKQRAERFAAWKERRESNQEDIEENAEISPVDRLARASERLSARAAELQKLAAAAKPLYDSLDDGQKRRFAVLFRAGQGRHWRREG